MEELISRIANAAGVDPELAQKAVGIILDFLNKEGPADQMQQVMAALPGASDLLAERAGAEAGGGGLLGAIGGMMGGGGGAMAALGELTSSGLSMGEVQSVTKELVSYAKEKAGDDVVDDVISNIPGLSQII
ncbi:conserved hypothetical protein [Roseibium sp. TrichSKD4]|uniref:DUF2267 domain-containing protein n=1 Tax=Roseibium sp. TrichSKD4 TaxID=744980 RepID=UPI0001E571C5|nr:DUF2267 domain-containing protein [Roseibium sp. TrichSKD4]EFO29006.1 conserved hypothetical protein [Roseibium sp. TrichSKD4]